MSIYKLVICLFVVLFISGCNSTDPSVRYDCFGNKVSIADKETITFSNSLIKIDGYVYITDSDGQSFNEKDDPEFFSDGRICYRVTDQDNYYKLSVGDEIGGKNNTITLCEAKTVYEFNEIDDTVEIVSSYAKFDGKISLTGYITIGDEGEIAFLPADGEWDGLPMVWRQDRGYMKVGETIFVADAPVISLGNLKDYTENDIVFHADRSPCKVGLTIDELNLLYLNGEMGTGNNLARALNILYL